MTIQAPQVLPSIQLQMPIATNSNLKLATESIDEILLQQTLQSALASGSPSSLSLREVESLATATAAQATASHDLTTQGQDSSITLKGYSHMTIDGQGAGMHSVSELQRVPPLLSTPSQGRGRGGSLYDSIVEYRCCWSGTYRPRNYENKTGQKRQRAASTKVSNAEGSFMENTLIKRVQVGCKARFVIRKIHQTGEFSVTYHCKENPRSRWMNLVITFSCHDQGNITAMTQRILNKSNACDRSSFPMPSKSIYAKDKKRIREETVSIERWHERAGLRSE